MYTPPCSCGAHQKYVGYARQEELVFQCLKCKRYTYYGANDLITPHPPITIDLEADRLRLCTGSD